MPAKIKQHQPNRLLPDHQQRQRARERQGRRFLPTWSAQWRAIRKAQLERFPLCVDCGEPANEVDHIEGDTSRNLVGIDLASRCKPCHSRKTAGGSVARGCDVDGTPR
jgi:5-methylcytosine-specific restriction endonuclease McrA